MKISLFFTYLLLFVCCHNFLNAQTDPSFPYIVKFEGVQDQEILDLLKNSSQSVAMESLAPKSATALRKRAEGDISNLINALHSLAYYNGKITLKIDGTSAPAKVIFHVYAGPKYPFGGVQVVPNSLNIETQQLGICLGRPAYPKEILEAEEILLQVMTRKGYPLAKIKEREVVADQTKKEIFVTFHLETGPLSTFGPINIIGNCSVKDQFFRRKISWRQGNIYNPCDVDKTLEALESTGLFRSVTISYDEESTEDGRLPMTIQVAESKHRSIGLGIGYSTQRGPGFNFEWEHRNIRGLGEKFSVNANILQKIQELTLNYIQPDFRCPGEDLIWTVDLQHDDTEGFEESALSLSGIIEKQWTPCSRFSYGAMYKQLQISGSDNDGSYSLIKTPLQFKWSNANDLLDPTCGSSVYIKAVPTAQLLDPQFIYTITSLTGSHYRPVCKNRKLVLAAKMTIGSIIGSARRSIPPSERFYAGSENTLRGYSYYTVSPLDDDDDPIGGRSMFLTSVESRWRMSEQWGSVLFYDVGNVYSSPFPQLDKKMLQSVGVGVRYYTPVGPLRLDVAFPLNRRKNVDKAFQVYFSVGQTF